MWAEAIQAPVALMLSVLVSSMNSAPDTSVPLTKTGTCNRMRGERRAEENSTSCPFLRVSIVKGFLWVSTKALVRMQTCGMRASGLPEAAGETSNKCFITSRLQPGCENIHLLRLAQGSGNPLPFLNCANGTLLPLTLSSRSVTMPPRENFYHSAFRNGID